MVDGPEAKLMILDLTISTVPKTPIRKTQQQAVIVIWKQAVEETAQLNSDRVAVNPQRSLVIWNDLGSLGGPSSRNSKTLPRSKSAT